MLDEPLAWQVDDFGRLPARATDLIFEFQVTEDERLCVFADSYAEAREFIAGRGGFAKETIKWTGTHRRTWLWDRHEQQTKRERGN